MRGRPDKGFAEGEGVGGVVLDSFNPGPEDCIAFEWRAAGALILITVFSLQSAVRDGAKAIPLPFLHQYMLTRP